jgi:hypothetical protein
MSEDIIEFWSPSQMPLGAFIHPKDQIVIDRIQNRFHKDCLPASFYRPLINARVILLFLSLGYTEFDSRHAETAKGRNYYERQRRGTANLPTKEEHPLVHQWLTRILRQFDLEATSVGDKLAILNICAYHSRKFHDFHMLTTLPSSRAALDYAQFVLFPQAEAGERVMVCLRTHRLWGLVD